MSCYGQNRVLIDSLRKLAVSTPDISHRYNLLNAIATQYRLTNPDSTIAYGEEAFKLGQQHNMRDLARPLNNIALAKRNLGRFRNSFDLLDRAVQVARSQGDSIQLAFAFNNQALLMMDNGEINQAFTLLSKARKFFEENDYQPGLAEVYSALSDFYKIQGDYKNAIQMGQRSLVFQKAIRHNEQAVIHGILQVGALYEELNDSVNTHAHFRMADSVSRTINDPYSQFEFSAAYAKYLVRHGNVAEADELMKPVYQAFLNSPNVRVVNELLFIKGSIAKTAGRYPEAIEALGQLVNNPTVELVLVRDSYRMLSEIFFATGQSKQASGMRDKYNVLKDSIENIDLARRIDALSFQLEIEKRDRKYDELVRQEENTKTKLDNRRTQAQLLIGIIVLILLFLGWQIYSRIQMKKANTLLSVQKQAIEEKENSIKKQNQLLSMHNRMLSEMNLEKDNLMEVLVMDLKTTLESIDRSMNARDPEAGQLATAKRKASAALQLINDIVLVENINDKLTLKIEQVDLRPMFESIIEKFAPEASRKNIKLSLNNSGQNDIVRTDAVYVPMIAGHLVANGIRFSPPGATVTVDYGKADFGWFFRVADSGPGFTPADQENLYQKFRKLSAQPTAGSEHGHGLGLAIVKLLADSLGATIELQSIPGAGSTFKLTFYS